MPRGRDRLSVARPRGYGHVAVSVIAEHRNRVPYSFDGPRPLGSLSYLRRGPERDGSETVNERREKAGYVTDDLAYPSVELIVDLHEQIVEDGDTTESGVRSEDAIASALQYISEGFFGEVPETIHDKAIHLMRLLVAEHPFVDGNKRTALRTVVVFYMLNGYTFDYGDEIRALLHRFATDAAAVDTDTAVIYFRACARRN